VRGIERSAHGQRLDFWGCAIIYESEMLNFRPFSSVAVSIALATPAIAADATLIVDRSAQSVALSFKMAATDLRRVFGMGAEGLLADDGTVDVPRLYDGMFPLADEIFASSTVRLGGTATPFEALSMMVHDPDILPDFTSPYDAELSIAVCTSPETVLNMSLATLEGYLGFSRGRSTGLPSW
jgi:hypothetical protein